MSSCNVASGMASGILLGMVLGSMLEEAEPIDFKCMKCGHSFSKHSRNGCDNGVFNKCGCRKFELNEGQIFKAIKYSVEGRDCVKLQPVIIHDKDDSMEYEIRNE